MFTSADLIEALRRRMRRSIRPPPPSGEFPPAWRAWFESMGAEAGAVTGAPAPEIVAVMLQREPVAAPGWVQLNRWQAFTALWRQQWHPASEDERWLRVSATVLSLVLHVVFVVLLVWLMHARFMLMPQPAQRGEHVVEVTFIGAGTAEEEAGGGPPQTAQVVEDAERSASPAPAEPPRPSSQPSLPPPSVARSEPTPPLPSPPPVEQPLAVTETSQPDMRFVAPPPRSPELAQPRIEMPEVPVRSRDIEVVEIPDLPTPPTRPLPQAPVEVPDLEQPPVDLVEREIAAPLPRIRTPELEAPAVAAPDLQREARRIRTREIPLRPAAGERAADADAAERSAAAATQPAGEGAPPSPSIASETAGGTRPAAPAAGSGAAQTPAPGAWQTPRRGDDWGDSAREQPGGQQGTSSLFNADGSPRLPEGTARVGGGLPPGTITEDFEKIDRMGTWLKRPPTDYEPTSFDRFWVPNETLLEEWVRRSIRTVLIPIPGTTKTIRCDVITLALAGGCSITDPNMQDVEAEARPPPDVPFKRELFEDPDSLGD
ncbi:hypothetical protein [Luteimonas sp. R10]|uniref:hypothetical protein n=1 Tax=Luteimonas sp. R10 TaxID=3108176 RepID=UPI003086AE35|nr:hypothetical protein U3649_11575 [Luteimonas sp. R10]